MLQRVVKFKKKIILNFLVIYRFSFTIISWTNQKLDPVNLCYGLNEQKSLNLIEQKWECTRKIIIIKSVVRRNVI